MKKNKVIVGWTRTLEYDDFKYPQSREPVITFCISKKPWFRNERKYRITIEDITPKRRKEK